VVGEAPHAAPPRIGEVDPSFFVRCCVELLGRIPHHGSQRGRWPTAAEPMMIASEPSPMGERLKPSKWSAMNSRLPKRMVLLREKPLHDRP
jgi:hypothetical protein